MKVLLTIYLIYHMVWWRRGPGGRGLPGGGRGSLSISTTGPKGSGGEVVLKEETKLESIYVYLSIYLTMYLSIYLLQGLVESWSWRKRWSWRRERLSTPPASAGRTSINKSKTCHPPHTHSGGDIFLYFYFKILRNPFHRMKNCYFVD